MSDRVCRVGMTNVREGGEAMAMIMAAAAAVAAAVDASRRARHMIWIGTGGDAPRMVDGARAWADGGHEPWRALCTV